MVTSEQIRAARALVRWEQRDLAEASKVSLPTVKRLEAKTGPLAAQGRTADALVAALEAAGVQFIPENGGGAGVRMAKRTNGPDAGAIDPTEQQAASKQAAQAAVDRALKGSPASPEEKAERKRRLTEPPKGAK